MKSNNIAEKVSWPAIPSQPPIINIKNKKTIWKRQQNIYHMAVELLLVKSGEWFGRVERGRHPERQRSPRVLPRVRQFLLGLCPWLPRFLTYLSIYQFIYFIRDSGSRYHRGGRPRYGKRTAALLPARSLIRVIMRRISNSLPIITFVSCSPGPSVVRIKPFPPTVALI